MSEARPPLLLIATTAEAERLRGALTLACAEAALGGSVHLFLQLDAVGLIAEPVVAPHDEAHAAAGLPRLCELLDDALELGVAITACQSGLALCGAPADALDPRVTLSGPLAVLAEIGVTTRLVLA